MKPTYGGQDDYGSDYGGGAEDYSGAKKPCKKCDCATTPVYEMDDACRRKCIKPTATATKPCTTPTPTPTKPCTTSVPYQPTLHVGTSPVNESRPKCVPSTITQTQTQVQYKTLTATQTVIHTSMVTTVKVVPTTVVKVEMKTVHNTATVTKTCTQTSTVHDTVYKTVTKESTKTITVGAKPTEETKAPCHECEVKYPEVKPTATSDYPTVLPSSAVKSDYGYPEIKKY